MSRQHKIAQRMGSRVASNDGHPLIWGVVGVTAQIIFTAGWLIAETWQGPRYSPITDTISDLQASTAPHVWFPIVCFALGGLGSFGFAVFGLRPALAEAGRTAWLTPWMLAFSSLAVGNSFPLIPCQLANPGCTPSFQLNSPGGLTDAIVTGIGFLVLAITPFLLLRRLSLVTRWRRLKPVMLAAGIIGSVCYLLLAVSSSMQSMPAIGLIERLLATTCVVWIGVLASTLIVESRRVAASDHPLGSHPS
jgi:Protein of unknown function (DUF998)